MKKCKKEYDFTGLACEITGDALYLINGGKEIGNSYAEQAQASPGDTVTDSKGVTHELTQGDINWAKQKIAGQETATQTAGNAGAGNTPGANHNTGNQREDRDLRVTPENYQDPATDARGYYSSTGNYGSGKNNTVKGTVANGNQIFIGPYVPVERKKEVISEKGSLFPLANYKEQTSNQNKEQKVLWAEATFVDGPGEDSSFMQIGGYSVSTELNNSSMNKHLYAQGQADFMNANIIASATNGGCGVGFTVNGASISGKIGFQTNVNGYYIRGCIGGSLGVTAGIEGQLDFSKGVVFDFGAIFKPRIEVYWGKESK